LLESFSASWPLILTEEILFFLGIIFLSFVRAHNPAILDLEKFMDAGFMASYLRSPTLPAPDIWLSGKIINYYTFGHFLGSVMSRLWLMPIRYSYNLLLALIMGLSFQNSFSVIANLIHLSVKKTGHLPKILGGVIGAFFVTFGGNTHTFWYLLKNLKFQGYWYADATRFIDRTIHEFPSYSFVVSDLHAHVWNLPLVLVFIIILMLWIKSLYQKDSPKDLVHAKLALLTKHSSFFAPSRLRVFFQATLIGLFLGTFLMTSTWDFIIYGLLTTIIGIFILFHQPQKFLNLLFSTLIAAFVTAFVAAPWYLNFISISEGPALATEHSPLWQIIVLWTGHVTLSLLALGISLTSVLYAIRHKLKTPNVWPHLLIIAMILTAWLMLLLPELIFFKDIYTGHPRANTMFKFTYQGFILMSLLGGWVTGTAIIRNHLKRWAKIPILILVTLVFVATHLFPYFAYRDYYGALKTYKGLDGWAWMTDQYADDLAAIEWIQDSIKGQPNILESWGESYTTFDRVSAYTGLPTVIGWRVHEWLWRGGFDIAGKRSGEVDNIYKKPLSAESLTYLNQYQVEYIIIGAKEKETYKEELNLTDLLKLGPTLFRSGDTYIVKYTPQSASFSQ
jgi:uncharacterized membrane protein